MENGEKKTVSRTVIDREVIMRKYHVHIKNFRNLKDVKVTLSPLTILTGENGSGKSTFFKALLFLKHNHTHEAAKKLKYVIDDDINLGGWEQIANDPKKPISIKITEETWGYDHQVEEVYDIDNCPFELNPSEEYVKLCLDKFSEIIHLRVETPKPIFTKKIRTTHLTLRSNNREYIFKNERLRIVRITTAKKRTSFDLRLFSPPFEDEIENLDGLLNPYEKRQSYVTMENISSRESEIADILFKTCSLYFYFQIFSWSSDPDSWNQKLEIFRQNFSKITIDSEQLSADSKFRNHLSLILKAVLEDKPSADYYEYLEYLTEILFEAEHPFYARLGNYISLGTVREIPSSRYFPEQIQPESYYGIFHFFRQADQLYDIEDIIGRRYQISSFNNWLDKFSLGKEILIFATDDVVKSILKTNNDKEINLSEASSGTLQLLPLLFTLAVNHRDKSLISVQQPELHLHPRLHSLLADLFVNQLSPMRGQATPISFISSNLEDAQKDVSKDIKDLEDGTLQPFKKGMGIMGYSVPTHLIIETHSEHLLKKLQVLVSQGKTLQLWPEGHCSGEDVKLKDALSIYYFAKDAKGNTKAIEMELDDNGFFKTETPKGFFDESLDLNRQLLLGRN